MFIDRPFLVNIINQGEIRMGSPYKNCEIELQDFDKIKLPAKSGWQDKYCWSDDSKKLVLIKWDFENNEPGFHFFIIDTATGNADESERIFGLVNDLVIHENKIRYNKFLLDRSKSRGGYLCCNTDEEYQFK